MKFTNILRELIVETSRFEYLFDVLTKSSVDKEGKKQKPKLSKDEFFAIVEADPTSALRNIELRSSQPSDWESINAGKYTQWLIKQYLNLKPEVDSTHPAYERQLKQVKDVFMEDLYKVTNDLKKFDRFKSRLPQDKKDINKITSVPELYDLVKDFSLEKTKASKEEKKAASETYEHPGGEIVFRGPNWTVVKVSDTGRLGKDAACFYGGYYLEPSKGETRWCTSSPGLNWFDRYIKDGPLYVVIPNNWEGKRGEKSGLPATRYQFHFQSNQYMDTADHSVDLIGLLNGEMKELKDFFKPEFAKGLTTQGKRLEIDNFDSGAVGKFVSLYGLEDLFKTLPDDIEDITIQNRQNRDINIKIPEDIDRFQKLEILVFDNCISTIPTSVCNLKELRFFTAMNCDKLTEVPECFANMTNLAFLNFKGSKNVVIPDSIKEKSVDYGDNMYDLS